MTQTPLVSIVIPAYNQGEYLEAAIESVLTQRHPCLECIVIDDGSTDDTLAVAHRCAQRHAPSRLKVFTQPNAGQSAALNRGWALARGEILGYLSSDDRLCEGAVETLVAELVARPDATVAYCDYWLTNAQGQRMRPHVAAEFNIEAMHVDLVQPPGPGALFRREVLARAGGWNTALRQVPDFDFWLRASTLGPFVRVPRCLAECRIHDGSSSFRMMSRQRADEIVDVVTTFWRERHGRGARRARSNALTLSARNHAQSGRVFAALACFAQAVWLGPATLFDLGVWRRLLSGFARRAYYGLRTRAER
ncbi:glycosyltransferase family 2 protein [Pelomonas sp. Root1217]|uniref:glycosyltransferase family 2 protein n=1 Tax=Pelomonas sp. Root1217 TaxID=1736430 RepID=UPI000AAFCB4E|nr:glycosyltransferase family 2 protein [Pelomonas sp. Root1217]